MTVAEKPHELRLVTRDGVILARGPAAVTKVWEDAEGLVWNLLEASMVADLSGVATSCVIVLSGIGVVPTQGHIEDGGLHVERGVNITIQQAVHLE